VLRRLAALTAVGLALAGIVWGLLFLQGIFVEERDDALEGIAARRGALEQFALKELGSRLRDRLAEARPTIRRAKDDPLLPASSLWLRDRGEQLLPRRAHSLSGTDSSATRLYQALRSGTVTVTEPDSPWGERVALFAELQSGLAAGDRAAIEATVRSILGHRARFVVVSTRDIPFVVAMLDELAERSKPAPKLISLLLREGLAPGQGPLEGVQRALLRQRHRFSQVDIHFLSKRIVRLSQTGGVLFADFEARVDEGPAELLPIEGDLRGPALALGGRWYVEPGGNERAVGVAVELGGLLGEISASMRDRGLIDDEAEVTGEADARAQPLSSVKLAIESPLWAPQLEAVQSRYRLKAWLLVAVAVLSLGVVALAGWVYRRRQRFLQLKGEFVSAVSHELRTPLASIRLMAETIERRTRDNPRVRDYPTRIIKDVDGLALLIENILSFDRLDRGRLTPKAQRVSLASIVQRVDDERDVWSKQKPVEVSVEGLDDAMVNVDPDLIAMVLSNLMRNACQYNSREPVQIALAAAADSDAAAWMLSVSDNGVGIPDEDRARVFDDFYRAKDRTGSAPRGSGLGLAICRKILEAHGGSIEVASTGAGGTTFVLRLPAAG
jgi:signal transduction histidine kinase